MILLLGAWLLFCLYVSFYDAKLLKVPPYSLPILSGMGILYMHQNHTPYEQVLGAFLVLFVVCLILGYFFKDKIGMGDLKILLGSCFFVPLEKIPVLLIVSGVLSLTMHLLSGQKIQDRMPFSPCLLCGITASMLSPV